MVQANVSTFGLLRHQKGYWCCVRQVYASSIICTMNLQPHLPKLLFLHKRMHTHTHAHTHAYTHTHTHTHSTLYSGPPHPQITYTQSIQQQYTESLQEQPGGNCLTMKQICKVKGTTAKILMGGAAVSWAGATKNILKEAYKKQKNQRPRKLQLMWTKPWEEFKKTKNKTCTSWQTKEHVKITGTVLKAHVL